MGGAEGGAAHLSVGNAGVGLSNLRVTIDRLALGGFDSAERRAFVEGFERELARALASPTTRSDLSRSKGAGTRRIPVLKLNGVALQPGVSGARSLGGQVAKSIARRSKP
jgi:hypothetical protein